MLARKLLTSLPKDRVWNKITVVSIVLFFAFLGDAILSFWVPNLMEESLGGSLMMGLVLSFSSIIGLIADIILPNLFRRFNSTKLIYLGILTSIFFALTLILAVKTPLILIFLTAMAIWGVYYEFLGFAGQEFVSGSVPIKLRSSSWATIGGFKSMAYFAGPLLAGFLILRHGFLPSLAAILFNLIAFLLLITTAKTRSQPTQVDLKNIKPLQEISHWKVLLKILWPVIIISLCLGMVDAFFWSVGAVWTQKLGSTSFWGKLFLPIYTLPTLFMGFIVVKWGIYKGKKIMAEKFLLVSGVFLASLSFIKNAPLQILIVLVASIALSVVYPLIDAVYSDVIARMGKEKKHLIGLTNSTTSIAYILGPALAGLTSKYLGERTSIGLLGLAITLISWLLLFTTPKKLRLPQLEIKKWD